ncbi:22559_t:CDS:1 [Gigaspora margarita]|uniref:22559_t:CDS:1 n=1 Tax=Gigaspora margarita TaxID=4874 RepID=A0ABN7WHE9_GIGMA|nr:22559_t:CDS:1 [Gigaspora margarita]
MSRKFEKNRGIELKKKDRQLKNENEKLTKDLELLKEEYENFKKNINNFKDYNDIFAQRRFSCKCDVKINGKSERITLDSGCSGLSSMCYDDMIKLNLKIIENYPEDAESKIASGKKIKLFGETNSTIIEFQDIKIPITFRVREGTGGILIDIRFLYETKAMLNFEKNTLVLSWNEKIVKQTLYI